MELGIILPSYRNLLRITNKEVADKKLQKSKADDAAEKLKTKDSSISIANQNNGRVVDVSI